MIRRLALGVGLVGLVTACGKTGTPAPKDASAATGNPVTVTKKPEDTADGGFVLDVGKQLNDKTSKALVVKYTWGGKPEREAWVSDAGESWRVQFQDKPRPTEVTTLKLTYSLPVDAEKQKELQAKLNDLARALMKAADAAFSAVPETEKDKPSAFRTALIGKLADLAPLLEELDAFETGDGKRASDLALRALGITRNAGKIELTETTYTQLYSIETSRQSLASWERGEKKFHDAAVAAQKCGDSVSDPEADRTALLKLIEACRADLTETLEKDADAFRAAGANKKAFDNADFSKNWEAYRSSIQAVSPALAAEHKLTGEELPIKTPILAALTSADRAASGLNANVPAGSQAATLPDPKKPGAFAALQWAVYQFNILVRKEKALEDFGKKVQIQKDTLTQEQVGSLLLERSQEKRYWDFATGAAYVVNLDDTVVPILLAFCPWTCLRRGENLTDGLLRTLSFDVGTRTGVIDKNTDPRHLDRPGLLIGGSINPFYFVRASFGLYGFENAQTNHWNNAFYMGVTVNVINAVELLGPLGIGGGNMETKEPEKKP